MEKSIYWIKNDGKGICTCENRHFSDTLRGIKNLITSSNKWSDIPIYRQKKSLAPEKMQGTFYFFYYRLLSRIRTLGSIQISSQDHRSGS